jgi:hypothetical protein
VVILFFFSNLLALTLSPSTSSTSSVTQDLIGNVFRAHAEHGGVRVVDFHTVTKTVCDLPSYCSAALFLKLQPLCAGVPPGVVTYEAFLQYVVRG